MFRDATPRDVLELLGTGAVITALGTGTVRRAVRAGPRGWIQRIVGNTLTGVDAGGLPGWWTSPSMEPDVDGRLEVEAGGLVIDPDVGHPAAGTTPIDEFRAVVGCLTLDDGAHGVENVRAGTYPATDDARPATPLALRVTTT